MATPPGHPPQAPGTFEFTALAAALMSMLAVSIDIVLPALGALGSDLRIPAANDAQYVVSFLLLGMAIGQLCYGPLSDTIGRKPALVFGQALFALGCLASFAASDLTTMLIGRFLQGFGAAGPRVVTVALVRDQYVGAEMARIMSVIVSILMIGPLLAPFLGQGILLVSSWRSVFLALVCFDLLVLCWLAIRQPETHPPEQRRPFSWAATASAAGETLRSRAAIGYALAAGLVFGELFAYVGSAQQVYVEIYDVGVWFPAYFALTAVAVSAASLLNARIVERIGPRRLCKRAAIAKVSISAVFVIVAYLSGGVPPMPLLLLLLCAHFFCAGSLFGNLNALAMEPLGHIAGVGAAIVGSLTWCLAALLGALVGQQFDGTVLPLAGGLLALGLALLAALSWAERSDGKLG